MAGYMVSTITVTDPKKFKAYAAEAGKATALYGGEYLVRGGAKTDLEGSPKDRIVVIRFPDRASAERWYNSPEYQAARKLREGAAIGDFAAIEGHEG